MSEDDEEAIIIKGRIFDNMNTIEEYTTSHLARKVDMSAEEIEPYLEELADDGRIRKRDGGETTKWVRFG